MYMNFSWWTITQNILQITWKLTWHISNIEVSKSFTHADLQSSLLHVVVVLCNTHFCASNTNTRKRYYYKPINPMKKIRTKTSHSGTNWKHSQHLFQISPNYSDHIDHSNRNLHKPNTQFKWIWQQPICLQ